jgi:hypothetical protein
MLDLRRRDFIALLGFFGRGRKCSRFANLARIPSSSTTAAAYEAYSTVRIRCD